MAHGTEYWKSKKLPHTIVFQWDNSFIDHAKMPRESLSKHGEMSFYLFKSVV